MEHVPIHEVQHLEIISNMLKGLMFKTEQANSPTVTNCDFTSEECPQCDTILTPQHVESHTLTCPKELLQSPFNPFGYTVSIQVSSHYF